MLVLSFYVKHLQGLPRLAQCSQGIEHDKDSRFSYQAWGLVIYIVLPNVKGISSMKQLRELGIIETVTLHVLQKIHKVFSDIEALWQEPCRWESSHHRQGVEQGRTQEVQGKARHSGQDGGC